MSSLCQALLLLQCPSASMPICTQFQIVSLVWHARINHTIHGPKSWSQKIVKWWSLYQNLNRNLIDHFVWWLHKEFSEQYRHAGWHELKYFFFNFHMQFVLLVDARLDYLAAHARGYSRNVGVSTIQNLACISVNLGSTSCGHTKPPLLYTTYVGYNIKVTFFLHSYNGGSAWCLTINDHIQKIISWVFMLFTYKS